MATKVLRVLLTGTGAEKKYDNYIFHVCTANVPFPKRKERDGVYVFQEHVEFQFVNMPQVPKLFDGEEQDSFSFRWFECDVEITDPKGAVVRGRYSGTYNKREYAYIFQTVDFSISL